MVVVITANKQQNNSKMKKQKPLNEIVQVNRMKLIGTVIGLLIGLVAAVMAVMKLRS